MTKILNVVCWSRIETIASIHAAWCRELFAWHIPIYFDSTNESRAVFHAWQIPVVRDIVNLSCRSKMQMVGLAVEVYRLMVRTRSSKGASQIFITPPSQFVHCLRFKDFTFEDATRVAQYLSASRNSHATVIDVVSWLYSALMVQAASGIDLLAEASSDWPSLLAARLEGFRSNDGGYAKTHEGSLGSTYHSFLVALCYELIGQTLPSPDRLVNFIRDRQRDDGGFVEIAPMKRSGTNPTAAAIAVLMLHSSIGKNLREDVLAYLKDVRSGEGGFQANTRIPFADTLSTFTGYLTCVDLDAKELVDHRQLEQFILQLECPEGGFRAAAWDQATDVEYSFYALGTLGLLWSEK